MTPSSETQLNHKPTGPSTAAPGVLEIWRRAFLFSVSWGALVIVFRDLRSMHIVLGI